MHDQSSNSEQPLSGLVAATPRVSLTPPPTPQLPPRCVACDYDLSGIPDAPDGDEHEVRCPECSTTTKPGEYEASRRARSFRGVLVPNLKRAVGVGAASAGAIVVFPLVWMAAAEFADWLGIAMSMLVPGVVGIGGFGVLAALLIAAFGPLADFHRCNLLWPLAPSRRAAIRARVLLATLICVASTLAMIAGILAAAVAVWLR
jgi:hypothetical protein